MVVDSTVDASSGTATPREDLADDEVDLIFRALADATRRDIMRRTLTDSISVSVLAEDYDMSFAAVQKHVSVLESAGLVNKNRKGRERLVRGNPDTLRKAQQLLARYERLWRQRIDRLDALLAEDPRPLDHDSPRDPDPSHGPDPFHGPNPPRNPDPSRDPD